MVSPFWMPKDSPIDQRRLGSRAGWHHGLALGADNARPHPVTVASQRDGRGILNKVAALAAYLDVPVESLWHADYYTQQRIERLRDK